MALRILVALCAVAVLTVFALLLVTGNYRGEGQVVIPLTPGSGIHRGDLLVVAAWLFGTCSVVVGGATGGPDRR